MKRALLKHAVWLAALLGSAASAVDVRVQPASPEVTEALRAALKSLEAGGVTFTLVTNQGGPVFRIGGTPAFNPDLASRSFTRGGQQIVEINPRGPLPVAEAVKQEVSKVLGLNAATDRDVRSRYGGADLNADGAVNLLDFAILTANYGKSGSGLQGDLNRDGRVDGADLQEFSRFYKLP